MQFDGATLARECGWNLNLAWSSSWPVAAGQPTEAGFHDVFGNVWQWLEDHFNPLPGAKVHPYYDDFSTPCYDGQHQMILGGSWASTGDEASLWARFHFRPHFFQHAGFRLVRSDSDGGAVRLDQAGSSSQVYEDPQILNDYLLLHYGAAEEQMPYSFGPRDAVEFPVRCARWLLDAAREYGVPTGTALEVGCAVGRASFELARGYREVLGVDLSRAFIDAADTLRRAGELRYFRKDEGQLGAMLNAMVDPAIDRSRVSFRQADACSLPAEWLDFDAVLLANLLCRLPSPKALLGRLGGPRGLVKPGGLLAIFSPYSWLEPFTPPEAWLGGYERDGKPVRSAAALARVSAGGGIRVVARSRRAAGDPRTCPEISVHRDPRHLVAAGSQRVSAPPAPRVSVTGINPLASGMPTKRGGTRNVEQTTGERTRLDRRAGLDGRLFERATAREPGGERRPAGAVSRFAELRLLRGGGGRAAGGAATLRRRRRAGARPAAGRAERHGPGAHRPVHRRLPPRRIPFGGLRLRGRRGILFQPAGDPPGAFRLPNRVFRFRRQPRAGGNPPRPVCHDFECRRDDREVKPCQP